MLDAPDPDTKSTTSSADQASHFNEYATTLSDEEGREPDSEELLRQATLDNTYQKHFAFRHTQAKFDDRQADYQREVEAFHRLKGEGRVICSYTEFDNNDFFHVSQLTRNLILAEKEYKAATARAKALGLRENLYGRFEDFHSERNDGYTISQEACVKADIDHDHIESWLNDIPETQEVEHSDTSKTLDLGNWNAKSIEIEDSLSMRDYGTYNSEIEKWQKHCKALHDELSRKTQVEDRWTSGLDSLSRRKSC